jgi:hypothetical protein
MHHLRFLYRIHQVATYPCEAGVQRTRALGVFFSYDLHKRVTDGVIAMTVRELRAALAGLAANSEVQVVLFKSDGTCDVFEFEEVLSNNGHA